MKRWLFNILAAMSMAILLFLLWSWFTANFTVSRTPDGIALYSWAHTLSSHPEAEFLAHRTLLNFGFLGFKYSQHGELWKMTVPYWFRMLLSAILPATWILSRSRTRVRRRDNKCLACGYNVSGTCPECGTAATSRDRVPDRST
jgi:hypothetical protein